MKETPYKIHLIRRRQAGGTTVASYCSLNAILKFDCFEIPHCVYVENVAVRLAQTLHIPVADGVLTMTGDGHAYASLEVASPGISLPDMLYSQRTKVAASYPDEVAALTAFDILIGNWDRTANIKASITTPHIPLFRGFDHSHTLLTADTDPAQSIALLQSLDLIVTIHPFYDLLSATHFNTWVDRIMAVDDLYIAECCRFGRPFRSVDTKTQDNLANALVWRKNHLKTIVTQHRKIIFPPKPKSKP